MNQREKDIKFIKKGKLIAMIFGLLSIMNIIILIGKNSSYALFRRNVQSKRVIEIHTASEFPPKGEPLIDKLNANLTSSNYVTDSDGTKFLSGTNDQINFNYVWYSGKLWRITAINPDNTIKMMTQDNITAIHRGEDMSYKDSWIYQWLNEDFLDTLYNQKNIIVQNAKWNATEDGNDIPVKPPTDDGATIVEGSVGLLNAFEYIQAYKKASEETNFLNIGYDWWLITPYSSTNIWYVDYFGYARFNSLLSDEVAIRPVINLKSDIKTIGGDGTKENPYRIRGDLKSGKVNDKLNSRVSGEYVNFDGKKYRIVGIENEITKLTSIDYVRDENSSIITKTFSSIDTDILYGSGTTINTNYWAGYLNNTWYNSINETYKNMLVEGTYYLGTIWNSSYKNAICKDNNTTESTKKCIKTNITWTGYVGLPRLGEMFSSQLGEGYSSSKSIYLITPSGTSSIWFVYIVGHLFVDWTPSSLSEEIEVTDIGVRPSITLNSNIYITSGEGTEKLPYEIKCDNCNT